MKKITLLAAAIIILAVSPSLFAQQTITVPDTLVGYNFGWVASFNGSQASFSNWSQGGVNSISGTASSSVTGRYRKDRYAYGFRINLQYGRARIDDQGVRKTDDIIALRNRWMYKLVADNRPDINLFATAGFESQFDEGFDFENNPEGDKISDFLAPAYFTENAGLAYQPKDFVSIEAGLGLKQTIVTIDSLATLYGVKEGENFRSEGGISTGITFEREVLENIILLSQFNSFTNFLRPVSSTDISWSNQITGQINSYVSANLQFELKYDDDFSTEIQTRQILALGLAVNLF